jgi:hypothetical protein
MLGRDICFLLSAPLLVAGCAEQTTETVDPARDLVVSFTLEPDTVESGDTLLARLTITNPTFRRVAVIGESTCLFHLRAYRNDELVFLPGTLDMGCGARVTIFGFPPGKVVAREATVVAATDEPGTYVVRAFIVIPPPKEDEFVLRSQH